MSSSHISYQYNSYFVFITHPLFASMQHAKTPQNIVLGAGAHLCQSCSQFTFCSHCKQYLFFEDFVRGTMTRRLAICKLCEKVTGAMGALVTQVAGR